MPRTTLNLDPLVLQELQALRRREGRPLGDLVSELVRQALRARPEHTPGLQWVSKAMGARVNLDDKQAVQDALDEDLYADLNDRA